jgi:hypothetical protein
MQALYLLALVPVAETTADPNSLRLSTEALDCRCHRAVLHGAGSQDQPAVGS